MKIYICTKCGLAKNEHSFYKNVKKQNGLESNCKECVLMRKAKKYQVLSKANKKTKYLRKCKRVKVLEISDCTFEEQWIIRPSKDEFCLEKEFIGIVLCNYKLNMELATAA